MPRIRYKQSSRSVTLQTKLSLQEDKELLFLVEFYGTTKSEVIRKLILERYRAIGGEER